MDERVIDPVVALMIWFTPATDEMLDEVLDIEVRDARAIDPAVAVRDMLLAAVSLMLVPATRVIAPAVAVRDMLEPAVSLMLVPAVRAIRPVVAVRT